MNLDAVKPYAKAVAAGAIAFAGAVAVGYADNSMLTGEWWASVSAGLTAAGGTWVIPNAAKAAKPVPPARLEAMGDGFEAHDDNGAEDYKPGIVRHDP